MSLIIVEDFNGDRFTGGTARQVVEDMRASAFGGEASDGLNGYMRQVAKRAFEWSGKPCRTNSPQAFLDDLVKAGLITRIAGNSITDPEE